VLSRRMLGLAAAVLTSAVMAQPPEPGMLPTVAVPPAGECLYVKDKGADPTGAKDSAPAFQQAIDSAAGKKVCVPAGTYRIGKQLSMKPGTHIVMARDAVIANAAQVGPGNNALFQSESFTAKTSKVTIEGGTFTSGAGGRFGGRVFGWYGDDWTVRNVYVKDWAQDGKPARAINAVGDNARIQGNTIRGPGCAVGCAAIVITGGRNITVADNDVAAGDDGIAIFPAANTNNPHFNLPIRDVRVTNNRSESREARALAIGMHYLPKISEKPMDTTVENVFVSGLRGRVTDVRPTGMAVLIENITPKGVVRNIVLEDVHIERTNAIQDGFKIARPKKAGALSDITIARSSFDGTCTGSALRIIGADGVKVRDSRLTGSATCAAVIVDPEARGVDFARGNELRGKVVGRGR